jgi:hypothetical protein
LILPFFTGRPVGTWLWLGQAPEGTKLPLIEVEQREEPAKARSEASTSIATLAYHCIEKRGEDADSLARAILQLFHDENIDASFDIDQIGFGGCRWVNYIGPKQVGRAPEGTLVHDSTMVFQYTLTRRRPSPGS